MTGTTHGTQDAVNTQRTPAAQRGGLLVFRKKRDTLKRCLTRHFHSHFHTADVLLVRGGLADENRNPTGHRPIEDHPLARSLALLIRAAQELLITIATQSVANEGGAVGVSEQSKRAITEHRQECTVPNGRPLWEKRGPSTRLVCLFDT